MRGKSLFNTLLGYQAAPTPTPEPLPLPSWVEVDLFDVLVKISVVEVKENPYQSGDYAAVCDLSYGKGNYRNLNFRIIVVSDTNTRQLSGTFLQSPVNLDPHLTAIQIVNFTLRSKADGQGDYNLHLRTYNMEDNLFNRRWFYFAMQCREFWAIYDARGKDPLSLDLVNKLASMSALEGKS